MSGLVFPFSISCTRTHAHGEKKEERDFQEPNGGLNGKREREREREREGKPVPLTTHLYGTLSSFFRHRWDLRLELGIGEGRILVS